MTNDHKDTHIHTDTDLTYDFHPSFYGGRSAALHPEAFSRAMSTGISVCCIIAGVILLVPSLIAAILSLVALTVHTKKKYDDKSGKDV